MKSMGRVFAATGLSLLFAGSVSAQVSVQTPNSQYVYYPYAGLGLGNYYGNFGGGTSQYYESQGMAEVLRAQGQYQKDYAEAVSKMNEEKQREVERRYENRERYLATKRARDEEERQLRQRAREFNANASKDLHPRTLTAAQFLPDTGTIIWPPTLRDPLFDVTRGTLETLFKDWSARVNSGQVPDLEPIIKAAELMRAELKKLIRKIDASTYISAKQFIDGLEVSARMIPMQAGGQKPNP